MGCVCVQLANLVLILWHQSCKLFGEVTDGMSACCREHCCGGVTGDTLAPSVLVSPWVAIVQISTPLVSPSQHPTWKVSYSACVPFQTFQICVLPEAIKPIATVRSVGFVLPEQFTTPGEQHWHTIDWFRLSRNFLAFLKSYFFLSWYTLHITSELCWGVSTMHSFFSFIFSLRKYKSIV